MAINQVELYKKKLNDALKTRQELERTYQTQFATMTQFINRLSNVCKGIDTELDNRLGKLRSVLQKNPDLENISFLIEDISLLLNQHSAKNAQNMRTTQESMLDAGKKLQQIKGLEPEFRRDLRQLLSEVQGTQESILEYLPFLDRLVSSYQQALEMVKNDPSALAESADGSGSIDEKIQQQVTHELLNILSHVAFSGQNAKRVEEIREVLSNPLTADDLVENCIELVRLIVTSITDERKSAQSFLFTLNDALSSVHQAVTTSITGTQKIARSKNELNDVLKTNLTEMGKSVDNADSLDGLKVNIKGCLSDILDALTSKEELEKKEQTLLLSSLDQMSRRLKELESDAEGYKKKLAQQRFKSLQDALTKLPNRAALDERMELEFKRWLRYKKGLCIAVADVDFFKRINDTYGHSAGDRTLQVVAVALKKSLRESDFIARYGGEEFVMIFPESDIMLMQSKLDAVREAIKRIPFKFKDKDVSLTISMGATQFKGKDSPQEVFDRADAALYKAKNTGRDKVIVAK